ncbi:hypothetical protein QS306_08125 [Paraburkholderia bonniea]|uniref:hypothetical protein n=1 Tax=Paraburkholderia bonniea TaxID=2152891 RepID=UPI001291ADC4|nr:hypothetical protein [Paraburkholderia bonniea]WJF89108.1 hypothetical protein QS306_08125 [Paraburkholderia bonniea]WJF92424.1 hypothetical protein QS308_08135 [Paraburkholderia bonniea]
MNIERINQAFFPIIGEIAWSVKFSHGSYFMVEFGKPHLKIREPIHKKDDSLNSTLPLLRRRRVFLRGEWSLFILDCKWKFTENKESTDQDQPTDVSEKILQLAEGQRLKSVSIDKDCNGCIFNFDMGAKLHITPFDNSDFDQWRLHCSNGEIFSLKNNGLVNLEYEKQLF